MATDDLQCRGARRGTFQIDKDAINGHSSNRDPAIGLRDFYDRHRPWPPLGPCGQNEVRAVFDVEGALDHSQCRGAPSSEESAGIRIWPIRGYCQTLTGGGLSLALWEQPFPHCWT